MTFTHNRNVKSDPRSDIIAEGTQCNRMSSCAMTSATSLSVICERQGM